MIFNVNFSNVINNLIPGFLRKPKFQAILNVFASALQYVNNEFYAETQSVFYYLKFNAQVIYLTKYLNDQYDNVQRRISISDGSTPNVIYLYNESEAAAPFYLYNESETLPNGTANPVYFYNNVPSIGTYDYYVNIPLELSTLASQVKGAVNQFNPANKTFYVNVI